SAHSECSLLKVESQTCAQRPIVRGFALDVELRRVMKVELSKIVFRRQPQAHGLAETEIRSNADVRGKVGGIRLKNRLGDVVAHCTGANLREWLQAKTARRRHGQIELQTAVVQKSRAVRDGVAAE